jgi:hypothetical protein
MKTLDRFLLAFVLAIALAFASTMPLWSQTPQPVSTPATTNTVNSVKSGAYSKVACAILTASTTSPRTNHTSTFLTDSNPFPKDAKEGTDYECGYLTVPEFHRHLQGKTIQVGVAIIKSTNPKPAEPLLLFQGGPGGSSMVFSPVCLPLPAAKRGSDYAPIVT